MIGFGDSLDAGSQGKREVQDAVGISDMYYLEDGSTISSDRKGVERIREENDE